MWEALITFFSTPPPALDPVFIPWLTALIAGNIIIVSGLWALLKYIAKITPWAVDDKIVQIVTGGVTAVRDVVSPLIKKKEAPVVEEECAHEPDSPDAVLCGKCGQALE